MALMAPHRTLSKHSLVALVGVALAGTAAWWWQQPASAQGQPAAASATTAAKAAAKAPAPVSVEVAPVQRRSVQDQAQAVGSLLSRQSVVLRPEVGGRVVALAFEDGQRVRRGQTLVRLDDQLQRAQVRQAQAEAGVAQTNHQRNQELVAQGFISQRSLDESAAALEVAQAKLALAQAQLERLRITAPFDGTLGIRQVAVGDYLKDGADIVNLEDMDALYVDFRLPERYQRLLRTGQSVQLQVDALPGQGWQGTVQAINPLLDAQGRSVAVRACVDNRRQQLRPGMFARVSTQLGERTGALMVPEEAVQPQGSAALVYRVRPAAPGQPPQAERVAVELGVRLPGWVEVVQGLAEGDTVVVSGQQRIQRDGVPLKVVEMPKPAPALTQQARAAIEIEAPKPGANPCAQPLHTQAGRG